MEVAIIILEGTDVLWDSEEEGPVRLYFYRHLEPVQPLLTGQAQALMDR